MNLPPAPPEACSEDGKPRLGVYRGAPERTGFQRAGTPFQRRWRRKFWQYTAVVSPEVIAAVAVVHLGYVGVAFALAWDRTRKIWFEREALLPLARGLRVEGEPFESTFSYRGRAGHIALANSKEERTVEVRFQTPAGVLEMDLELAPLGEGTDPLTAVGSLAADRFNLTVKEAGVALGGRLLLGERELQLDPESATALIDWTQGIPPRDVSWNWAMAAGKAKDGRAVGFNLCVGYTDPANSENGVWIEGVVHPTGPVSFEIPKDANAPWRIRGVDGVLDLEFRPEALRQADTNLFVAISRYRQPVGRYTGTLPGPDGERIELADASGVAEDHQARW